MRHIIRTLSLAQKAALIDAKAVRAEDKDNKRIQRVF